MFNRLFSIILIGIFIHFPATPGSSQFKSPPALTRLLFPIWDSNLNSITIYNPIIKNQDITKKTDTSRFTKSNKTFIHEKQIRINENINVAGERSYKLDDMDINIQTGSINKEFTGQLPLNPPELQKPLLKDIQALRIKELISNSLPDTVHPDTSILKSKLSRFKISENIDTYADEKFSRSEAGRELMNLDSQTDRVTDTEELLNNIDFRQIKESVKNSNTFRESISKLSPASKSAPSFLNKKIQSAQLKLKKLKHKYSRLPSSGNSENAERKNTLKDNPLHKRLVWGGHVRIAALRPFSLDLAPLLGFRINKKLQAGFSGKYSKEFDMNNFWFTSHSMQTMGYGIFIDQNFYRGLFAHFQFERKWEGIRKNDNKIQYRWSNGFLIGLGREYYIIKKIHGTCLILYDVLEKGKMPDSNPLQIRVGFISGM